MRLSTKQIVRTCLVLCALSLVVVLLISHKQLLFRWHVHQLENASDYDSAKKAFEDAIKKNPSLAEDVVNALLDDKTLLDKKAALAELLFVVPRKDLVEKALTYYETNNDPANDYVVSEIGSQAFLHSMPKLGWSAYAIIEPHVHSGATWPVEATVVLGFVPKADVARAIDELRELAVHFAPANRKVTVALTLQYFIDDGKLPLPAGISVPSSPTKEYYEALYDAFISTGTKTLAQ